MIRLTLLFSLIFATMKSHAWMINSDFETGSVGEKPELNGPDSFGAFSKTRITNEQVHSGSHAVKATIIEGTDGWGDFGGTYKFPSKLSEGDELWARVWVYYPKGFNLKCGCSAIKFLRTRLYAGNGDKQADIYYFMRPGGMYVGTGQKDFIQNHPWPHEDITDIGGPIEYGSWHAYEYYTKFSATPGKGAFLAWIDGELIFEDRVSKTLYSSSSYADGIYMWTYWNNGAPQTQSAYLDDVLITNERPEDRDANGNPYIGLGNVGSFTSPPNPPNLK